MCITSFKFIFYTKQRKYDFRPTEKSTEKETIKTDACNQQPTVALNLISQKIQ